MSRDPDAMREFVGGLFGWQVTADNGLGYREVAADGGVGGGIWPAPPEAADLVQLFVGVDDVDAALVRASALGATVIVPRQDLPGGDRMAVIAAPGGSTWASSSDADREARVLAAEAPWPWRRARSPGSRTRRGPMPVAPLPAAPIPRPLPIVRLAPSVIVTDDLVTRVRA